MKRLRSVLSLRAAALTAAGLVSLLIGCTHAAHDRLLHFFFEIPDARSTGLGPAARATPGAAWPTRRGRTVSIHPPFLERKCMACHSGGEGYLPRASSRALCGACHADVFAPVRHLHGPFAAGACGQCHAPHTASEPTLLRAADPALCLHCHESGTFQACPSTPHPWRQPCQSCHHPHGSEYPFMLKSPARAAAASPRGDGSP